jgi:hypothetical protein
VREQNLELTDDDLVVALSRDNAFMHVGTTHALLGHAARTHAPGPESSVVGGDGDDGTMPGQRLDVYDSQGHPLRPILGAGFVVVGWAIDTPCGADSGQVLQRIRDALDLAQQRLTDDPGLGARPGLPPVTRLPVLRATTLPDVLDELAAAFALAPGTGHQAGWFHNLFHVIG